MHLDVENANFRAKKHRIIIKKISAREESRDCLHAQKIT